MLCLNYKVRCSRTIRVRIRITVVSAGWLKVHMHVNVCLTWLTFDKLKIRWRWGTTLNVKHTSASDVGCKLKGQSGRMALWFHVQPGGLWKFLSNRQSREERLVTAHHQEAAGNIHLGALGRPFNCFFNLHMGKSESPFSSINEHTLLPWLQGHLISNGSYIGVSSLGGFWNTMVKCWCVCVCWLDKQQSDGKLQGFYITDR